MLAMFGALIVSTPPTLVKAELTNVTVAIAALPVLLILKVTVAVELGSAVTLVTLTKSTIPAALTLKLKENKLTNNKTLNNNILFIF